MRALTRQLVHQAHLAARLTGHRTVAAMDKVLLAYDRYANGPYPMFWSGVVRQGRLDEEALQFLAWTGQSALAGDIRRNARLA